MAGSLIAATLLACLARPAEAAPARRQPPPDERAGQIAADYSATFSRLDRACDWQLCSDRQMRRLWALVGEWLASYLDAHPAASAADLAGSLKELHAGPSGAPGEDAPDLAGEALELRPGDFLMTVRLFETGTFFIVGRSGDGAARVKWTIDRFAASPSAKKELRCWRVEASCGPLYGSAKALPPTAAGDARFYVDANHAGNGMTVGAQTSLWAWNGRDARLLAVDGHLAMLDDDRQIEFDGQNLLVPTKEVPRTFFSCGACPDPAGTWTLRLTPNGAEDLGHRWRNPELRWADELFDALQKGRDTSHLAASEVAQKLTPRLGDVNSMLFEWTVTGGTPKTLSMAFDDVKVTFTLKRDGGRLYATAATME